MQCTINVRELPSIYKYSATEASELRHYRLFPILFAGDGVSKLTKEAIIQMSGHSLLGKMVLPGVRCIPLHAEIEAWDETVEYGLPAFIERLKNMLDSIRTCLKVNPFLRKGVSLSSWPIGRSYHLAMSRI